MLIYTHNHDSKPKSVSRMYQRALSAFVRSTELWALNACHRRGKSEELLSFGTIPMFVVESGSSGRHGLHQPAICRVVCQYVA